MSASGAARGIVSASSVARATAPRALLLRGPSESVSGFDSQIRGLARGLAELGVDVGLLEQPDWQFMALPKRGRVPLRTRAAAVRDAGTVLHVCMPHELRPVFGKRNVNLATFECTRIFDLWVRYARLHDLVVVPTEFARQAWIDSGVAAERLRICPLGVDPERFRPGLRPLALRDADGRAVTDYRVRVLNVSAIGDRKNLLGLIGLWLRETNRRDDAILVVKLSWGAPIALVQLLRDIAALERTLRRPRAEAAPICFLTTPVAERDMPRLHAAATHYLSLSRGEGWDMAMIEAGACGTRLIAPSHSAYTTYLDESVARMLPARAVPADWLVRHFGRPIPGARAWEVCETAAAEALRQAIDGTGRFPSAHRRLRSRFTWRRAAERLLEITAELEGESRPARGGRARRGPAL